MSMRASVRIPGSARSAQEWLTPAVAQAAAQPFDRTRHKEALPHVGEHQQDRASRSRRRQPFTRPPALLCCPKKQLVAPPRPFVANGALPNTPLRSVAAGLTPQVATPGIAIATDRLVENSLKPLK